MLSRLFGKKPTIEDLQKLLAQARRLLWNNQLSDAEKLFNQVLDELENVDPKTPSSEVNTARLQTRLGIWAISYFRKPEQRSIYERICEGHTLNAEIAFFIAKVFQTRKDKSSEAVRAYMTLLRLKPAPNLAQKIGDMFVNVPASKEALQLLEAITQILNGNLPFKAQLCRWYLKLDKRSQAQSIAREILLADATNGDAHRCLGYLAEIDSQWDTAIQHYTASHNWLRVVVTATKANRLSDAEQALSQIEAGERDSATGLYYRGWIAYRRGNMVEAERAWQQLQLNYSSTVVTALNQAFSEHTTYRRLQTFDLRQDVNTKIEVAPMYEDIWALKRGVALLLLEGDVKRSKPLLQKLAAAQRESLAAATYYGICVALEGTIDSDASIYQYLIKQFGDASLFLWLRGLLLLRDQQQNANQLGYLIKASNEGIFDRHLPLDAGRAANWLVLRLTGKSLTLLPRVEVGQLLAARDGKTPFIEAVLPSFALAAVKAGSDSGFLQDAGQSLSHAWSEVRGIILASQRQWQRALQSLENANASLKMHVIQHATADAVRARDWQAAAHYVAEGIAVWPDDPILRRANERLGPFMRQRLWSLRDLSALDHDLEKHILSDKAPTAVYHQLAIVYTQIAVQRDKAAADGNPFTMEEHRTQSAYIGVLEDYAHNDYWQLAVGYWAVALSDNDYWRTWAQRRSGIYGEEISQNRIQELVKARIPNLLHGYHQEQSGIASAYATHHRYYGALMQREPELTSAVRYLIRFADTYRITLPLELRRYISPLLVKEYGYEQTARQAIAKNEHLRMSPYEAGLLHEAFSPISDVKALVEIKDYATALERLRWLVRQPVYQEFHIELQRELIKVIRLAATQYLDDEKWEPAGEIALQGLDIQPRDKELEQMVVKASIGWAGDRLREDSHAAAIRKLEQTKSKLQGTFTELNQFLSEIYVEWALQAINEDDLNVATTRLEKAISVYSANGRAREIISVVYNDRAVEKAQAERFSDALREAETALRYNENARSFALIAMLNRSLAVQAAERNDTRASDAYWVRAREVALKHIEIANTQESLDLFVQISVGYVVFLYSCQVFRGALQIGEALLELNYDPHTLNLDLRELLSAICTDYGAELYNRGNRWEGRKLSQKALQYNPSNMVARQNLNRM